MKKYSQAVLDEAKSITESISGRNPAEVYAEKLEKHQDNLKYLRKVYNFS